MKLIETKTGNPTEGMTLEQKVKFLQETPFLTTGQAASFAACSQQTVIRACDDGDLRCRRVGNNKARRILHSDFEAWLDSMWVPQRGTQSRQAGETQREVIRSQKKRKPGWLETRTRQGNSRTWQIQTRRGRNHMSKNYSPNGSQAKGEKPTARITSDRPPSQSTRLVELSRSCELFHDAENTGFAVITRDGHNETYRIRSKPFRDWLARQFHAKHASTPGTQSLQDAIAVIEGGAVFEGTLASVGVRIAGNDERVVLDLANDHWQSVVIDRDGWRIENQVPERFIRPRAMMSLPTPEPCPDGLALFRKFLNARNEELPLLVAWLIGALRATGPYPILALHGEPGSSKSNTSRMCRQLVDPNKADLRSAPRSERDLVIMASNSWIVTLDNVSSVSDWLSDALCRVATGGGMATRELYSDGDEAIFNVTRPILINGIEEVANRSDLLDRCLLMKLPTIPKQGRKPESELWREFDAAKPRILGWLLDCVSGAIRHLPTTTVDQLPRMADFAQWVVAAETTVGWESGRFLGSYSGNRKEANVVAIESSVIGTALMKLLKATGSFEGRLPQNCETNSAPCADEKTLKQWDHDKSGFPKDGRSLSGKLRRLALNIRQEDYQVDLDLRIGGRRILRIGPQICARPAECAEDSVKREQNANDVAPKIMTFAPKIMTFAPENDVCAENGNVCAQPKPRKNRGLAQMTVWVLIYSLILKRTMKATNGLNLEPDPNDCGWL